tara:strand:- start:222 stop:701 length:480 start_codon:yes stop_codon:yes gene_type:complete
MKKGYKILIGVALVGALYFAFRQVKKKVLRLRHEDLLSGGAFVDLDGNDIVVTNTQGNVIGEYISTASNMEFPMYNTGSPYTSYDNVAKLQTYLVFANADLELDIDGMYGDETEAAVMSEVTDLTEWGYGGEDYDYSEITVEYYDGVVLPDLDYFLNEQ